MYGLGGLHGLREIRRHIMDKLFTVKDLCAMGIGRDKAYALMHSSTFPAIKIGGRYFVTEEALKSWLKKYQYKSVAI